MTVKIEKIESVSIKADLIVHKSRKNQTLLQYLLYIVCTLVDFYKDFKTKSFLRKIVNIV